MKRFPLFRFGLRHLLLILALCALPAAWVGSLRQQLADERDAIHDVQMMGAKAYQKGDTTVVE